VAKNILSTQALMMGLYPATDANDLTEWQQNNAVPPMEGADFTEWQKELGAHALPFGLQTFPIQQAGMEADFLLSVSDRNCPYYTTKMKTTMDDITGKAASAIADISYQWASYLQVESVADICAYLEWAYFNSIDLAGDEQKQQDFSQIRGICKSYYADIGRANMEFDGQENHLMSSEFMKQLKVYMEMSQSATRAEGLHPHELPLSLINYQTLSNDILLTFAAVTLQDMQAEVLPPSSNLVYEFGTDGSLRAFLNDEEYLPAGCTPGERCTLDQFTAALNALDTTTRVKETCTSAEHFILQ